MKTCPACNTQYSDDTLLFCLQDGTPLSGSGDTPTVVLSETETVARGSGTQWQPSQVTHVATARPRAKGSNTTIAVILTVVGMLVLFSFVGIGAWIFFKNSNGPIVTNTNIANNANFPGGTNVIRTPTPGSTNTPAVSNNDQRPPVHAGTPTTPPSFNEEQERGEVSQRVERWRSGLESRDLNGYMDNYAPTVDYFRRRGASASTVRADKARAFALYSTMRVNVSNMAVTVGPSGETATAAFDKEWTFSGRDTSSGKVRSQLEFRKINGRWLITAERDLRVYYTR